MAEGFKLVVAEKPSVARDIARVLGVRGRGQGVIGNGRARITWCVGHLVELAEPHHYDDAWRAWRLDSLPMLPETFALKTRKDGSDQWKVLRDLLRDKALAEVVNACDAGREGELIFTYAYEHAGCRAPVRRLWISSMTDQAIKSGFAQLRPGEQMAPLRDAARCRSEADWLVGLNATRAMTTRMRTGRKGALLSVGRVQTPTLALLDEREAAIESFVPEDFWQVKVTFAARGGTWEALWTHKPEGADKTTDRTFDQAVAQAVLERIAGKPGRVSRVTRKKQSEKPPLLYDLTNLQKEANKRFGYSAQQTLDHAQALYERHKVLTYPRTDSRHLGSDQTPQLEGLVRSLGFGPYQSAAEGIGERWPVTLTKRVVDDSEVSDHHAIIPTGEDPRSKGLSVAEKRIFDLVARRFLAVFFPDAVFATARVDTRIEDDLFVAKGRTCLDEGWRAVDPPFSKQKKEVLLPPVEKGDEALQEKAELHQGQTKPPKRYNEATLLAAMESAGEQLDDSELKRAMKRNGLGTPATRAAIIETLLRRRYIKRDGKHLLPTPQGRTLLAALPVDDLRSPRLTGQWEARLAAMAEGEEQRVAFMADIRQFTNRIVDAIREAEIDEAARERLAPPPASGEKLGECPLCGADVREDDRGWACVSCPLFIPGEVARRNVSARMAKQLLADRRTSAVKGFKARSGKTFAAALTISDKGEVRFEFPDPDPLGDCPACGQPVRQRGPVYTCDTGRSCRFVVFSETSGRAIDEDTVKTLIARGETPWLDGFERGDGSFGGVLRWDGQRVQVVPVDPREVAGPAGACPKCGGEVRFAAGAWRCGGCQLQLPGEMGGRPFEPAEISALLRDGRTDRLHGFRQRTGAVFKAAVVLQPDGRVRWDYSKGDDPPPPVDGPPPAFGKRTDCPCCVSRAEPHPGYVLAGRGAWGCSRWKEGCNLRVPFDVAGPPLAEGQAARLFSKHRATRWEKRDSGRTRVVLVPDQTPCFTVESR